MQTELSRTHKGQKVKIIRLAQSTDVFQTIYQLLGLFPSCNIGNNRSLIKTGEVVGLVELSENLVIYVVKSPTKDKKTNRFGIFLYGELEVIPEP